MEDIPGMNIRNLPAEVVAKLRVRAARQGRSIEDEARAILIEACRSRKDSLSVEELQAWVDRLYGAAKPKDVADDLIAERRRST
jgi:plasmid stability protein